jgi:hypothetical protein
MGVEVENEHVAGLIAEQVYDSFLAGLEGKLKILAQRGGEQLVERAVFRIESNPDHRRASPFAGSRLGASGGEAVNIETTTQTA